jgi:hypothetical protein
MVDALHGVETRRSFCFDRRQFIEALWGRLAELGYMLFNYGY